jgi:hypothetical protein
MNPEFKRFLSKATTLLSINLAVFLLAMYLSNAYVMRHTFRNSETDSNMLIMPENQKVDLLIFGTSHGRNFSRKSNHYRVETILGKKVVNLSVGGGGGVIPASVLLNIFYEKGNSATQIVYFLDNFVLFSPMWNESNDRFARREPFSLYFLSHLILEGMEAERIRNYLKAKLSYGWLKERPDKDKVMHQTVTPRQLAKLEDREKAMFVEDGMESQHLRKYVRVLEGFVQTAQNHGASVFMVRPPLLFAEREKTYTTLTEPLLAQLKEKYGFQVYNHAHLLRDFKHFEDPAHLNTEGVIHYTQHYLKSMLLFHQ